MRCYTTEADYRAAEGLSGAEVGTLSMSECPSGYFCLWEWTGYGGDRVQYRVAGTKDLYSYWRDRGTSYYNRRAAAAAWSTSAARSPTRTCTFPPAATTATSARRATSTAATGTTRSTGSS
ncbi:peptidase inhibitor family I36 protein [Nonomuraea thailandensis]